MSRSYYQQPPQVVALGRRGFSLLLDDIPVFLAFQDFPAFAGAAAADLRQIHRPSIDRLHWPALDITLRVADLVGTEMRKPVSSTDD